MKLLNVQDRGFWEQYCLAELMHFGVACVPGQKIFNSDEKPFYPDFIGLYNTSPENLPTNFAKSRPLSVSVYIATDQTEFKERIEPLLDLDLRWPTELIFIFDLTDSPLLEKSQFFVFQMKKDRTGFKVISWGLTKLHDQVGHAMIMKQLLWSVLPVMMKKNDIYESMYRSKEKTLLNAMKLLTDFIYGDKILSIQQFKRRFDLDIIDGEFYIYLRRLRRQVRQMKAREELRGKRH